MEFRTEATPLAGLAGTVSHDAPVVLIGSCFSDNIGAELTADLFETAVNPFGPLYNPRSILRGVRHLVDGTRITPAQLFSRDTRWVHFDFHSRYSATTPEAAADVMNASVAHARALLVRASCVIITLGTTVCYNLAGTHTTVANCHKLPAATFSRHTMDVAEVTDTLRECVRLIRSLNPTATIIFTVSPLRYLADGLHANTLIKATLMLGIDAATAQSPGTIYFPAYEIMTDDLRDYRFYADDLRHPTPIAVRYIYDIFARSFFTPATRTIAAEARRLTRRLAHRPSDTPAPSPAIKELSVLTRFPQLERAYHRFITQQ